MKYIYVCSAVSEELNNTLSQSVAGNKFSINMAQALDQCCNGKLAVISTASIPDELQGNRSEELWNGKRILFAKAGKRFLLSQLKLRQSIIRLLQQIHKENPKEEMTLFLENAPFAAATACLKLKRKWKLACYSITIDTPFAGQFKAAGMKGRINKWMFDQGLKALQRFDGLISFTKDVEKELGVDIPFCELAIGCHAEDIPNKVPKISDEKTAVYAGTLIDYNGIRELLQAYALLGPEYQLHIYGYGPLESEVMQAAAEHRNIVFHGRFDPEKTMEILSAYPLLLNTRRMDPGIENFTFPSKLVDYVLTGKSVLTSNFKTLPAAFREFVYILKDVTPEAIAEGVREVFADSIADRQAKGEAGIAYVTKHQTYDHIAERILHFVED